jgi:hypothetical protein
MSDLSPHDAEQRAFVLGFSIAFYYAVGKSISVRAISTPADYPRSVVECPYMARQPGAALSSGMAMLYRPLGFGDNSPLCAAMDRVEVHQVSACATHILHSAYDAVDPGIDGLRNKSTTLRTSRSLRIGIWIQRPQISIESYQWAVIVVIESDTLAYVE